MTKYLVMAVVDEESAECITNMFDGVAIKTVDDVGVNADTEIKRKSETLGNTIIESKGGQYQFKVGKITQTL